jgi:hypothetical protein
MNKINNKLEMKDNNNNNIPVKNDSQITHNTKLYNKENYSIKKNINDHLEILFVSNVLIVEGYADYVFMKSFFDYFKIYEYKILIAGSKTNTTLIELCELLKINYKVMYDYDVLYTETNINKISSIMNDLIKIKNIKYDKINDYNYENLINILYQNNIFVWGIEILEIEGILYELFESELEKKLVKNKNLKYKKFSYKNLLNKKNKENIKKIKEINEIISSDIKEFSYEDYKNKFELNNIYNPHLKKLVDFFGKK